MDMVAHFRSDVKLLLVLTVFFFFTHILRWNKNTHMMCISLSKVHLSLELEPSARGRERLISESWEWIPLRWFLWWWGWLCVKVSVKGLFVPAQQPGMRERTEDKPEYNPVTGHASESSTLQPHSKFWLACTVLLRFPALMEDFLFWSPQIKPRNKSGYWSS